MYWEEVIELIKTHGNEPKSTYPNPYNDSDEYEIYKYERGTLSTSYIHIEEFSEEIKNVLKKYLKYEPVNFQIFCSLGASDGMGPHEDIGETLIICIEGEISYVVEDAKPVILKPGDSILIAEGREHMGVSSTIPRICISCRLEKFIPSDEVTYYFG
mgnify:FL=1|tara:strand:+ start:251 stop:721 length:471 start_codon:yes stop_codon:yes gene_type:complete